MAYITTVDHVRHLRRRNQDNGHFVDPAAAEMLSSMYVRLYDPPGINGTVFDGEGNPMTSDVLASDLELKLHRGVPRVHHGTARAGSQGPARS
jgi:hypothetical protein